MKTLKLHLVLMAVAFTLAAPLAMGQTCESPGLIVGPGNAYEYIANGKPADASCWTLTGNVSIVPVTGCGPNANAFDMHYGARVSQEFTVPAGHTRTRWDLNYLLTMQDPNDDGWWNRIKVTVYNVTTGRNVASQTYWGDDPDISCAPRNLTFNGNFAGQTLRVIFSDGSAYSNTVIRVRRISLIQY